MGVRGVVEDSRQAEYTDGMCLHSRVYVCYAVPCCATLCCAGAWSDAAEAYAQLLALADAAPPQDAAGLRSRRPAYLRRHAEAAARAGQLVAAEASWRALVEAATEAHQAAAAAAGGGGEAAAAALAAAEEELVECLCRLADVQVGVCLPWEFGVGVVGGAESQGVR